MKGLILCGGEGTRLRPLTFTTPKHLLPVANKPVAFSNLERIAEVGVAEVGVIIAPQTGRQTREAIGDGSQWGLKATYIPQDRPAGLAHAVKTAARFLGDSPFLMMLSDNLFGSDLRGPMSRFERDKPGALVVLKQVPDPCRFGVAELDSNGCCLCLEEKPAQPKTDLAVTGAYFFSPMVHEAISRIRPSWRNELEITDAIQELLNMGHTVLGHVLDGWWLDTGNMEAMLRANRLALEMGPALIAGETKGTCRFEGTVTVEAGATVEDSVIIGPAHIKAGCRVVRSTVGPAASLGAGTTVADSTVTDSIILERCCIRGALVRESIVGRDSEVLGGGAEASLLLGDLSKVHLGPAKGGAQP